MSESESMLAELKNNIKSYPDFPKKGVIFRDFFPLLACPRLFEGLLGELLSPLRGLGGLGCVAGLESRGFLLGPPLALRLGLPFVPLRKKGKLPGRVRQESYDLEYGSDTLEIQEGAFAAGDRVLIVDDLLATGGTLSGAVRLVEGLGGVVALCLVVMELTDLKGRDKVEAPLHSLFQF